MTVGHNHERILLVARDLQRRAEDISVGAEEVRRSLHAAPLPFGIVGEYSRVVGLVGEADPQFVGQQLQHHRISDVLTVLEQCVAHQERGSLAKLRVGLVRP